MFAFASIKTELDEVIENIETRIKALFEGGQEAGVKHANALKVAAASLKIHQFQGLTTAAHIHREASEIARITSEVAPPTTTSDAQAPAVIGKVVEGLDGGVLAMYTSKIASAQANAATTDEEIKVGSSDLLGVGVSDTTLPNIATPPGGEPIPEFLRADKTSKIAPLPDATPAATTANLAQDAASVPTADPEALK